MTQALSKAYAFIGKAELWLAKAGVVAFTVLIFLSAVSRTAGRPWGWTIDWAIFVFVWCVFFSADVCLREDKLVTVDIVTRRLPPKVNAYLKAFNLLLILVFLAFLVYFGISLTYTSRFVRFQGLPFFSYSWVAVSLPVGAVLMLISSGVKFAAQVKVLQKTDRVGPQ